jgi:hypothetical protein
MDRIYSSQTEGSLNLAFQSVHPHRTEIFNDSKFENSAVNGPGRPTPGDNEPRVSGALSPLGWVQSIVWGGGGFVL